MNKTLVIAMTLFVVQPAHAVFVDSIDDDFTINWFLGAGQSDNDGGATSSIALSANAIFDVTEITDASLEMTVTFTNTTTLSGSVAEAGITTFGIGVTPNATGVTFSDDDDGAFSDAELQTQGNLSFPGGFKQIDVCVFTGGCSGGPQGSALAAGGSLDAFTLSIFGSFDDGVTLNPFPIKFQTTEASFEFGGTTTGGGDIPNVPEPAPLALIGLSGLLLGWMRRKSRI